MAKKEVTTVFKVVAPGGQATPAPPLGPALGGNGVNPGQFIQQFNAATSDLNGKIVSCADHGLRRPFVLDLLIKSSPASVLIKDAAKLEKGLGRAPEPRRSANITSKTRCAKIAEEKIEGSERRLNVESAMRSRSKAPPVRWA